MEDHTDVYREIHDFAYALAEQASALIMRRSAERWAQINANAGKKNSVDLVTETDREVEDLIKKAIFERYPDHRFIGEETEDAIGGGSVLTDEFTWIVDPIDGTMNFVHNNPNVCCSIGLTHRSIPVVGVIAQPFRDRILSAYAGGGAYKNRTEPLPLTGGISQPLASLKECMITAEWGSDRSLATFGPKTRSWSKLAGDPTRGIEGGMMCHALRTTGSSVTNIAAVAAGEMDVLWDIGCYVWDICAGACILQEAGGILCGGKEALQRGDSIGQVLMDRRYVGVRAVRAPEGKTPQEVQLGIIKEFYDVVEEWTNSDM